MRTRISRSENEKDKKKRLSRKAAGNDSSYVRRKVAALSKEQINRMLDTNRNTIFKKTEDPTGRAIFNSIQRKMEISQPHDQAEVQADKVAEGVMKGDVNSSKTALSQKVGSEISAKGEGGMMETTNAFDQQLQSTKGQGQKLDTIQRKELEQHTGSDLSGVNVHTNSNASEMSESINAKAFTHGQDIYFKEGQYNPTSNEGKSLLAHEVTHTVQQSEGKVQTKIQRQPTATTKVIDQGPMPHAEGLFHGDAGTGGYIITPATFPITKAYYDTHPDEKNKMLAEHPGTKLLFNTFYSLAQRFMIDLDVLVEKNKNVSPENIGANKKIIIPFAPMQMPMLPMKPIPLLKSTVPVMNIILPPDPYAPINVPIVGPVEDPKDPIAYEKFKKQKLKFDKDSIQNAAWDIVSHDKQVMDAYIYVQRMHELKVNKVLLTPAEQIEEVKSFFVGKNKPSLDLADIDDTGATTCAPEIEIPTTIQVKKDMSFSVSVSTYLHEMNHFMDYWYLSKAAGKRDPKGKRRRKKNAGDVGPGTVPVNKGVDLDQPGQLAALPEYETSMIDQIISDMKSPTPVANEHRLTPYYRTQYNVWLNAQAPKSKTAAEFDEATRNELRDAVVGTVYGSENKIKNSGLGGKLYGNTGVELGYSFEKIAYGYVQLANKQGVDAKNWGGNFDTNFEKKYYETLEKYKKP